MKKIFIIITVIVLAGCSEKYDDSILNGRIDNIENRVSKLEQFCTQLNNNIISLQTIIDALQQNDYITGIEPINENGMTVGYTITFVKNKPIKIYHGEDGKDGKDGEDGAPGKDGKDGENGKDGYTPIIGVKQDTDGLYYWTLDKEWLLDDEGNKIKASGTDGKDGEDGSDGKDGLPGQDGEDGSSGQDGAPGKDGKDGKDGITPRLKIENNYWYISYDDGKNWMRLDKATGEDGEDGEDGENGENGNLMFKSITQDKISVCFELADGTMLSVLKKIMLSIEFAESDLVVMSSNSTRDISYTIESATGKAMVEVVPSADIKARVIADDKNGLTGKIRIATSAAVDEYSKVIIFVSNGEKVIMKSLTFEEAGIQVEEDAVKNATSEGGELVLEFLTNVECKVMIPEDAQSWISVVPTARAMEKQTITLKLEPNTGNSRSAIVTVQSVDGTLKLEYTIEQEGDLEVEIDPTTIPDNEIWYRTQNNYQANLDESLFGSAKIIGHSLEHGVWKVVFDNPIKEVGFSNCPDIVLDLVLPNSVEYINEMTGTFKLSTFMVPDNLKNMRMGDWNMIFRGGTLTKLTGKNVSEDGRCIIIDNKLIAIAYAGLTEYTIPDGVKVIGEACCTFNDLSNTIKTIIIPEGVESIEEMAFATNRADKQYVNSLEYVYLPSTLSYMGYYIFQGHYNIKAFYGNTPIVSSDNMALISPDKYGLDVNGGAKKTMIAFASGSDLSEYSIPDGIEDIENYTFAYATTLKRLSFPSSLKRIAPEAFIGGNNIEHISGSNVLNDNRSWVIDGILKFAAIGGLDTYTTPQGVRYLGYQVLGHHFDLEEVVISDDVVSVESYGYIFNNSPNLKTVTISASMQNLGYDPFVNVSWGTPKLKTVYCRAIIPPKVYYNDPNDPSFIFDDLVVYVPEESLEAYKDSPDWVPYRGYLKGYKYTDLPEPDYYISTDYSQDGKVTTLQTATKGSGIDIVLMGDGYSDRQIADGTYDNTMNTAMEKFFSEEPYKTYRDHFNVYSVKAVSATEGYEHGNTAFSGFFGDGTLVGGNDNQVFNYALKAIDNERMNEALVVVMMNSTRYAGTCYMYHPSVTEGYGNGVSVSYFPVGEDENALAQVLHHEAGGHGFAKLADEYAYESMGAIPATEVTTTKEEQTNWGWWKNVDFTNNLNEIRWSRFINDTRYANDGLGAYEGGLTYWTGVWRPTENSIMRHNTGGFNAPSREAIYYRIHKLAYGDSWQYDYEEFVKYDAINRKAAASSYNPYRPTNYKPLHAPVVIRKSWKDAQ